MSTEPSTCPKVYQAICAVIEDLAKEGIAKTKENKQQGFKFRGIEQVYNALATLLPKHHLLILPRITKITRTERTTGKGTVLFFVEIEAEYDFISILDGSKHTVGPMPAEAMDTGDKATSKALSMGYKTTCFEVFCIPTEGDNDPDSTTHDEVKPQQAPKPPNGKAEKKPATLAEIVARLTSGMETEALRDSGPKDYAERFVKARNLYTRKTLPEGTLSPEQIADLDRCFTTHIAGAFTLCKSLADLETVAGVLGQHLRERVVPKELKEELDMLEETTKNRLNEEAAQGVF